MNAIYISQDGRKSGHNYGGGLVGLWGEGGGEAENSPVRVRDR